MYHVAVVGATGAVGQEILRLLDQRAFPIRTLRCFASLRSLGTFVPFQDKQIPIETLDCLSAPLDLIFLCAGSKISKDYADSLRRFEAIVIDLSSAFRQDPSIPLVIPEVNPHALDNHSGWICNPNCATILMLTVLFPLHAQAKLKRIVISTYQAASGAGFKAMEELKEEMKAYLDGASYTRSVIPHPYAFNLFLHNSPLQPNDYVEEELKLLYETRKILEDSSIRVAATCVRVPILRCHSESINAEFHTPLSKEEAYRLLQKAPGVQILEHREKNRFPMPIDALGKDPVFCGRIRQDLSQPNTLDLWVVGDQLLKGAALNAIQIAERLTG